MPTVVVDGFVLAYVAAGPRYYWPGIAMNSLGGALCAGIVAFNAAGRPTTARHFALVVGNLYVASVSVLFGSVTGFHYYFFAVFGLSFLVLTRTEWPARALFAALSVALFLYFERASRARAPSCWLPSSSQIAAWVSSR